jgi:hypothetical protein
MMKKIIYDEEGLSLMELLGTIVILSIVLLLFSNLLNTLVLTAKNQKLHLKLQNISNQITSQGNSISRISNIYSQAGYRGLLIGDTTWNISPVMKVSQKIGIDTYAELSPESPGQSAVWINDILDSTTLKEYSLQEEDLKIKIIQEINPENTAYYKINDIELPNYRDVFTIQTKVTLIFYKEDINFDNYYDHVTGTWNFEELFNKEKNQIVYSDNFHFEYRDDEKAKGGVPGNGHW